ncbi:MAG: alpha/beta hydrolase [Ignavibacteriales bacterium]|nr:alpha/beta hydrolase [Ignavibacteriales bacterium]
MKLLSLLGLLGALTLMACHPYPELRPMEYEDLQYPSPVHYAALAGGVNLAYTDEGQGSETIIFIHGLGSYLPAWKKNIEALKGTYRCIAIDLPGYGKSSRGRYPFTMEFYADVVVQLMDHLQIPSAVIAGHSMGGQIAMTTTLKYPGRVHKLVLISAAGFESFTDGEKQWFRDIAVPELTKNATPQQIRANVVQTFYNMPADAEFMVTDRIATRKAKGLDGYAYTVAQSIKAMVNQPVIGLVEKITQPTLIIYGENDNLIPNPFLHAGKTKDIADIGHATVKNSTLVMIPECGHFAQYEHPSEVNSAIQKFLR